MIDSGGAVCCAVWYRTKKCLIVIVSYEAKGIEREVQTIKRT